jgi:hypothetical protein
MSDELFRKLVDTTLVGSAGGGLLNAEQANRFIDYVWDATALGAVVRKIRMTANTRDIDKMDLGQRIARHATEGVDDHINASPTFSKIQVTTEKIRLDWELSAESLEDGIEQANLEDHIARLMATQLGNDLEDLAINGDESAVAGSDGYELLKAFDGYRALVLDGSASTSVVDFKGDYINRTTFNNMYKALPRKYKQRRDQLRFWTSSGLIQDWYYYLATIEDFTVAERSHTGGNPVVPAGQGGSVGHAPFGIPLFEIPLQLEDLTGDYTTGEAVTPTGESVASDATEDYHGYVELTHPDNRIWAMKREVKVAREYKPKKDTIEYTVFTRQGVQVDNTEAWVYGKNVRVRGY